jgi:hypothetical protein
LDDFLLKVGSLLLCRLQHATVLQNKGLLFLQQQGAVMA